MKLSSKVFYFTSRTICFIYKPAYDSTFPFETDAPVLREGKKCLCRKSCLQLHTSSMSSMKLTDRRGKQLYGITGQPVTVTVMVTITIPTRIDVDRFGFISIWIRHFQTIFDMWGMLGYWILDLDTCATFYECNHSQYKMCPVYA